MVWFPLEPLGEVMRWWQSLILHQSEIGYQKASCALDAGGKWDCILWVDVAGVIQLYCV